MGIHYLTSSQGKLSVMGADVVIGKKSSSSSFGNTKYPVLSVKGSGYLVLVGIQGNTDNHSGTGESIKVVIDGKVYFEGVMVSPYSANRECVNVPLGNGKFGRASIGEYDENALFVPEIAYIPFTDSVDITTLKDTQYSGVRAYAILI